MTKVLISFINFYQATLSPDHSFWAKLRFPHGYCRFYPSCSQYLKIALQKHGFARGLVLGVRRTLRCNPFASFGVDQVN